MKNLTKHKKEGKKTQMGLNDKQASMLSFHHYNPRQLVFFRGNQTMQAVLVLKMRYLLLLFSLHLHATFLFYTH